MGMPQGPPMTPEQLALLPHDNLGPSLTASIWILTILAASFLSLRLYCKGRYNGSLWWDDIILLASFIILFIHVVITTYLVSLGYGLHIWDFPPENFTKFSLPVAVRAVLSLTALAWSKTAFGVTLLRLTKGWMRWAVWGVIITVNLFLGLSAMLFFVQCKPLKAAWDPTVEGECIPNEVLYHFNLFSGAWGAAADFALALLPWGLLMGLQMRKKEKLGVGLAMSMGILAGIAALVKTVNLNKLHYGEMYDTVQLMIWDTAEASVTIVAASIPVLRVLIRDVRSTMAKSGRSQTGMSRTGGRSKMSNIMMSNMSKSERENSKFQPMDSRSDKSILYETQIDVVHSPPNGMRTEADADGGIVRTDTVVVQFDGRSPKGRDDDVEMGRESRHGIR